MDLGIYNSYVEINMPAMTRNYHRVKAAIGDGVGIIPVLKSNAYGHGTVRMAEYFIQSFDTELIAVSQLVEGVEIRTAGYKNIDILVMGALLPRQLAAAVEHDIQFALFDIETARALSTAARRLGRAARVQVKIETGLNRIGVLPGEELEALLDEVARLGNIEITGFFTHYSSATLKDEPFVSVQNELFEKALVQARARGLALKYIHSCNTGAASWFREGYGTHIRVGCILMGYPSMDDFSNPLGIEEPMSWRAFIVNLRDIEPGQSCGYNRHFRAEERTRVATVNVGYADGVYRPMAQSGGPVIINDTRTRYLATCMDQSFIDATGIDCKIGDEVTLVGTSRGGAVFSFTELEQITGQTLVYPMIGISSRVKRIYIF